VTISVLSVTPEQRGVRVPRSTVVLRYRPRTDVRRLVNAKTSSRSNPFPGTSGALARGATRAGSADRTLSPKQLRRGKEHMERQRPGAKTRQTACLTRYLQATPTFARAGDPGPRRVSGGASPGTPLPPPVGREHAAAAHAVRQGGRARRMNPSAQFWPSKEGQTSRRLGRSF